MNTVIIYFSVLRRATLAALFGAVLMAVVPAAGHAAVTITVTSLSDPSASGQCTLRDAIDVALGQSLSSSSDKCITSGTGTSYTIVFKNGLAGTITLSAELAFIINSTNLTITGPSSGTGITIDGGHDYEIFAVEPFNTLNLQFLTLADGSEGGVGGAILNFGGTLTITNSTFANDGASEGGAIYNQGGTLTITHSTFANNTASGGGAIYNDDGTLTIANSTFTNNTTVGFGGAIDSEAPVTVTNSTFVNNTANGVGSGGGAIDNFSSGVLTVTNSTFANNTAQEGGAIDNAGGPIDLKGTILAENSSGNCGGGVADESYNLADDDSCAFTSPSSQNNEAAIDLDPSGLQNNGGPTQTIALEAGSVAIDAIPVADCTDQSDPPVQLTTDQRGVLRPQGPACDIGAYEYDTARSLKTAALVAIQALSGGNRHDRQQLQIAASNLTLALRYYWQGNSGNELNPVLGILDFQAEGRAVNALQQILTPASQLPAAAIENYTFNIALADRTLAEVAISGAGGNSQASQLVANGDAASAAGNYSLAITYYSKAWQIVR